MNEPLILIIDDEPAVRKLLEITLESNGFKVESAATAKDGLRICANHPPELVLLDIGLPDMSGQELLKELRLWFKRPVIMLSVQSAENEIVTALNNGANDYLTKPFRSGELLARIKSALRNSTPANDQATVHFGEFELDLPARKLTQHGQLVKLTSTEYSLLALLAINEGRVLTHDYLLQQVWGPGYINETQYLRVFVAQLRKKIEQDPNRPAHILTESGIGYRLIS